MLIEELSFLLFTGSYYFLEEVSSFYAFSFLREMSESEDDSADEAFLAGFLISYTPFTDAFDSLSLSSPSTCSSLDSSLIFLSPSLSTSSAFSSAASLVPLLASYFGSATAISETGCCYEMPLVVALTVTCIMSLR